MSWKFTDAQRRVVHRVLADGQQESRLLAALSPEEQVAVLDPEPPPPPTPTEADFAIAKADSALAQFAARTPGDIEAWVSSSFPSLTAPERARLGKLCIAVALLWRSRAA